MTKSEKDKKIKSLMNNLNCSYEEALEICADDDKVDKMTMKELNATLTTEQKKAIKSATGTGTKKKTFYKFDSAKNKKKDSEKEEFIANLQEIVSVFTENCEIANPNREITFNLGENSYSLVLTKHTKKKK